MSNRVKAVIFGVDDVLYDASLQTANARLSAVKAMIEAGLPVDVETAYRKLEEVVKERGPDSTRHFDMLLERLGLKWMPSVVAAGVVAYRETSPVYLKPYSDTVPTVLKLRDMGYKLGSSSRGKSVKQWQKLIGLGLQHCFHAVVIAEDLRLERFSKRVIEQTIGLLGVKPEQALYIAPNNEEQINAANEAAVTSVCLRKIGEEKLGRGRGAQPRYEILKISELLQLIHKI